MRVCVCVYVCVYPVTLWRVAVQKLICFFRFDDTHCLFSLQREIKKACFPHSFPEDQEEKG